MAGLIHVSTGESITEPQYESGTGHDLSNGTSFPVAPSERDLYYRSDLHRCYIYNGSDWVKW